MNELIPSRSSGVLLPVTPRVPIRIRPGVPGDVPFMDSLQKMHTKQVGFFPTAQFEGNIKAGRVLVAEEICEDVKREDVTREDVTRGDVMGEPSDHVFTSSRFSAPTPIGYCIASDRYFKHDDVGIIYQMNVKPGRQRSLVGAMLLKAQFERSAYGCKLYCCWCAQDIAANRFWEAMGFVPLAFRTGSEQKSRVHIFWQKRIRQGDTTTPWWFPSETSGGAVRGNRIVLPIPPGTHWSDAKPLVLPGVGMVDANQPRLPKPKKPRTPKAKAEPVAVKTAAIGAGGLFFGAPPVLPVEVEKRKNRPAFDEAPVKKARPVNDPAMVAAARELRDRWLEQVNATPLLPQGKYDVSRAIGESVRVEAGPMKLLEAA